MSLFSSSELLERTTTTLEKHSVTIFGTSGKIMSFGSFGHKNNQFKSPRYVTTSPGNGLCRLFVF